MVCRGAAALLRCARGCGVYRPTADVEGGHRALLTSLASAAVSHQHTQVLHVMHWSYNTRKSTISCRRPAAEVAVEVPTSFRVHGCRMQLLLLSCWGRCWPWTTRRCHPCPLCGRWSRPLQPTTAAQARSEPKQCCEWTDSHDRAAKVPSSGHGNPAKPPPTTLYVVQELAGRLPRRPAAWRRSWWRRGASCGSWSRCWRRCGQQ